MCIIRFDWLIALYLFISLVCNASFLIEKNRCVREEVTDVVFLLQTKLQQITVQEHIFGKFKLTPLNFVPCTSPTDNLPFTYHFPSVSIPISKPLNCSPICAVDNFKGFKLQIDILDNTCQRRCYYFRFLYSLHSSGDLL